MGLVLRPWFGVVVEEDLSLGVALPEVVLKTHYR